MPCFELSHGRDTVRAHHEVDRAARKRVTQPTGTEGNVYNRLVLNEHRHDDITTGAEISDRRRDASARFTEWPRRGSHHVEDREFVSGPENAPRHPLTHATETDEADSHGEPLQA